MSEDNFIRMPRKTLSEEQKRAMLRAGGSIKTKHNIDAQAILREVCYGYSPDLDTIPDPEEDEIGN